MPDDPWILAIDLGTQCGWATHDRYKIVAAGSWNLKPNRHDGAGMRYIHLRNNLTKTLKAYPHIGVCAYEDVRGHKGTDAAQVFGGYSGALQAWCEDFAIPYEGIPVGTIKKHATGKGNAGKHQMATAATAKWPSEPICDDNEVDARFLAEYVHAHMP